MEASPSRVRRLVRSYDRKWRPHDTGKHIQLRQFWVQEAVRLGRFTLQHVAGTTNSADILTKLLAGSKLRQAAALAGLDVEATED